MKTALLPLLNIRYACFRQHARCLYDADAKYFCHYAPRRQARAAVRCQFARMPKRQRCLPLAMRRCHDATCGPAPRVAARDLPTRVLRGAPATLSLLLLMPHGARADAARQQSARVQHDGACAAMSPRHGVAGAPCRRRFMPASDFTRAFLVLLLRRRR